MFSTSSFFDTSDVMYYMSRCNERRRSFLDPISEHISVESMVNKENKQIRIFVLRENEHLERKLFRLKKGEIVQFVLSGSLFSKKVRLFCNHVQSEGDQFERKGYHKLKWQNPGGYYHDDLNKYAAIEMVQSGTFHFYFTVNDCEHPCGSGYLLVDPILRHSNQKEVSLDSLQCQTVISKCLGKFSDWIDRINVTIHSGFNMIHFTPLQELSHQSNSSYAIHDHLTYNPNFGKVSKSEMCKFIDRLFSDYGLMSVTDLVYNHVATGCLLLENNPEVAYNLKNSPHLRPAFLFDRIIYYFSKDVGEKLLESEGIPKKIESRHLYVIRQHLLTHIFPKYQFHEFVIVDIDKAVTEFRKAISDPKTPRISSLDIDLSKISIIQDSEYRRNMCTIDNNVAVKHLNADWDDVKDSNDRINRCCEMLRNRIADLNNGRRNEITNDVCTGVDNCIANCRYWFFESGASGYESVSANVPIAPLYFHFTLPDSDVENEEKIMYDDKISTLIMAFNGWTANNDALKSFADEDSHVYLRRELIVWNDLIKVRYGNCLDDCPALWKYMEQYTVNTAEVFKAVRLDNCHSTPLHVAEHMLDMARKVKSDLYIFGELFTGNEELDNIFVNKLGITSLVRESMSSYNAYDFGRQIYRYGGKSVGSFYHPPVRPIVAGVAHAIFYDITHDNMCPITTHSIYDILPRMFLTNMACCSTGSSRGYDELVPHHISVVTEERLYAKFTKDNTTTDPSTVNGNSGIIAARRVANKLHESLREEGFTQIYVDQVTTDIIAITRHNPSTHHSIVLVARTSFALPDNPEHTGYIRPLFIPGHIDEVIVEADLQRICEDSCNMLYTRNSKFINGLSESAFKLNMRCHVKLNDSQFVFISNNEYDKPDRNVEFKHFTPGCVIAFRVSLANNVKQAVFQIRKAASEFCSSESSDPSSFTSIVSRLSLSDLNRVLYRCSEEEMDDGYGSSVYNIPNYGELVYAGLQGFMSVMEKIRLSEDMGSPICENLRNGNWIMEYIVKRLKYHKDTLDLGLWFENVFENFKLLPRFLIPSYFDAVLTGAYTCIIDRAWSHMPSYIRNGSTLLKALSLVSVQLVGYTKSSLMPKLSPYLQKPVPEQYVDLETRKTYQLIPSLSAGLRHFSTGAFRNWGRDTFISLRGLLLLTGRHNEARFIILSYGQCLRHGLIPNLLGAGVGARYNCRDAYWWWLYSIKCYTESVDKGHEILKDVCAMMYPTDESPACEPGSNDILLYEVIHMGLRRHIQKMKYRERGAGYNLDNNMSDKGFNVEIGVDINTGFVYGGTQYNCGTWMDKMGSSDKAGNRGIPATPRDGSAVEIVGLSKSCIDWLIEMGKNGYYPYSSIEYHYKGSKKVFKLKDWSNLISANFEKHFWIGEDETPSEKNKFYVNRTGIFKDCVNSSGGWTDYQLRPNFLITLVVAPSLCDVEHAWTAILAAEKNLMGFVGVKTLDPSDLNYVPDYDNSNDSCDKKVAHGWGYHQGPEWLWLTGYLYRAMLNFANLREQKHPGCLAESLVKTKTVIGRLHDSILNSEWKGLPELTNSNGGFCPFSCDTQAWSASSLLELMVHIGGIAK